MSKKRWIPVILGLLLCIAFWGSGKLLDWEDEQVDHQLYQRDSEQVIVGTEAVVPAKRQHDTALVLIHGFGESPRIYQDLVHDPALQQQADVFAPLMPFHSRSIRELKHLNNQVVNTYLTAYLSRIAKQYSRVTVVARSYSGAQVVSIMLGHKISGEDHIQWVLYAPAIFIRPNQPLQRLKLNTYLMWRNYCNSPLVGCLSPNPASVDELAYPMLFEQRQLRFRVAPALKPLFAFDRSLRTTYAELEQNYELLIAKDDNLVDTQQQMQICKTNPHCHLNLFSGGRHTPHMGKQAKLFKQKILTVLKQQKQPQSPTHSATDALHPKVQGTKAS